MEIAFIAVMMCAVIWRRVDMVIYGAALLIWSEMRRHR